MNQAENLTLAPPTWGLSFLLSQLMATQIPQRTVSVRKAKLGKALRFVNELGGRIWRMTSSTSPPKWDDCPVSVPLRMALPAQNVDANAGSASTRIVAQPDASACSDDAHTAAQYPEGQGQCIRYRQEQAVVQVESTDFPIQNVESMQSNLIQTAYAAAPVINRQQTTVECRREFLFP